MRTAQAYEEDQAAKDHAELNLGMGTLIGIFFGLALICGVFFGFGYTLGHRPSAATPSPEAAQQLPSPTAAAPKPSAQQMSLPAESPRIVLPNAAPEAAATPSPESNDPRPPSTKAASVRLKHAAQSVSAPPLQDVSASTPAQAAIAPTGTIMVQIAAVKGHNDAEALASALRRNGFSPTIRTESQDKLLHVQVGPFPSRDEAKAMRQKLSNAGYNAFIK